jgi:Family of unknown function (DUF6364)
MAATKLTLRLEESIIEQAKDFARQSGKSLSQVVSDYFQAIARNTATGEPASARPTPITDRLVGSLRGTDLSKEDHRRHWIEKYQ